MRNLRFFEIYGVSARTRGEGGQFFAILCVHLLWTASNPFLSIFRYKIFPDKHALKLLKSVLALVEHLTCTLGPPSPHPHLHQ